MRRTSGLILAAALAFAACGGDDSSSSSTAAATTAAVETTTVATTTAPDTTAAPTTTGAAPTTTEAAATVIDTAEVTRSDDGSELTVSWTATGDAPVSLTWSTDPDAIDQPLPVDAGATSVTIADPAPGGRAFFRVTAGDSTLAAAERRVPLEGAPNFRDLGGYATEDGRHVKWGQVYRSGALADLTEADLAVIDTIGIQLVCDFRSDSEIGDEPDPALAGAENIRIDVNGGTDTTAEVLAAISAGDLDSISPNLLRDGMPSIALDFPEQWSEMLRRIADPANRPTNFHCTAGKDRTGWAGAMLLLTLGVPEETVMQDYLLSNEFLAADNEKTIAQVRGLVAGVQGVPEDQVDTSNLEALLVVAPEYLQAALDAVHEQYGSFDDYLTGNLGLTQSEIDALRDSLLE